jgi:tRNA G18 (ribose-2'-O)-methylase SpoU
MSMGAEIGERFYLENTLTEMIRDLDTKGFWVFALRQETKRDNWTKAIVEIYSKKTP